MKNLRKAFLLCMVPALIACGPKTPDPVDSNSQNESSEPASDPSIPSIPSLESSEYDTDWDQELAAMMMEVNGEFAPYIELEDGYTFKLLDDEEEPTVYILSKHDDDRSPEYESIVKQNGYKKYTVDESAGYTRYLYSKIKDDIQLFIQFDYYPGGDNPRGFEIFYWNDLYVPSEIDYDLVEDWTDDEKALMMDKFGEVIPLAPLSEDYVSEWVEEDCNIIITDAGGHSDALLDYYYLMAGDKAWTFSESFYQRGYIVFEKAAENVEYGVLHLNMRHTNKTGFIVDCWMTIEEPPVLITEWSAEVKAMIAEVFGYEDALPLAPISDKYKAELITFTDGFKLIDILDPKPIEDFYDEFIDVLEANGFEENDFYFVRFGYYVFDKVSAVDSDTLIEVNFAMINGQVSIQVYTEDVLGGTQFVDYFPTDQFKHWCAKNKVEYQEFPEFPSVVDGRYLYTADTCDFWIQIYQPEVVEVPLDEVYKQQLIEEGWVIDDSLYHDDSGKLYWGYFARKEGCDFYFRFYSDDILFSFHVYPNYFDPRNGITIG